MTALPTPLISAEALAQSLDSTLVLDVRFDLARPEAGLAAYLSGHIPGALYVHLDDDLSAKGGRPAVCGGRHPMPRREDVARWAGALGVTPDTDVVAYDAQGGMFAARLWWMLRWIGHTRVAVLDGGWPAWVAAGGASEEVATPRPADSGQTYPLSAAPAMRTVSADDLMAGIGRWTVLDARAPERYRGDVEPLDPVAGHIPGAHNRPFAANLDPATGRFLPAQDLHRAFQTWAGEGVDSLVHQCGSGVTACHNLLAMEAAGLGGSALYPGSWSEWCGDPARPVARG